MSYNIEDKNLDECINQVFKYLKNHKQINKDIDIINNNNNKIFGNKVKRLRKNNFPEFISENIVKFYYIKQNKFCYYYSVKYGDLEEKSNNNIYKIEVKCFSSNGPISFGPKESWNKLVILDAIYYQKDYYKIYEINLSNKSEIFRKLKVSKSETFEDQSKIGKRPRLNFNNLKKQLNNNIKCIWKGNINTLL